MNKRIVKSFFALFLIAILLFTMLSCKKPSSSEVGTGSNQSTEIDSSSTTDSSGSSDQANGDSVDESEDPGEINDGIVDDVAKDVF